MIKNLLPAFDDVVARFKRARLHSEVLLLIGIVFLLLGMNDNFWGALLHGRSLDAWPTWRFALSIFLALTAFHYALLIPFSGRRSVRWLLSVFVLTAFSSAYYMQRFGVFIDPAMLRNVANTDWREASELLNADFLWHMLLAVPVLVFVWQVPLHRRPLRRTLVVRGGSAIAALAVGVAALLVAYQDFSAVMREQRGIRYLLTPGNVVWSSGRVLVGSAQAATRIREPADPVQRLALASTQTKPILVVMVVGETARAANFGLNGYARMNTPQLEKLDVINFPKTTACGTSTEVSVPCMFSPFGRANYDEDRIRSHESLLHMVARAGLEVSWFDNQSGCKGVCDGLEFVDLGAEKVAGLCDSGHCHDEILVHALRRKIEGAPLHDRMVVLHQLGNHGPAYYKRYPEVFKKYGPACEVNDLGKCSQAEIVNAYDNAIAYTDHVLAETIAFLKQKESEYDVVLMYVSDHGESLGEHGLFLHGVPYAIAPREQTEVPMVWWLPPATAHNLQVDTACLRRQATAPVSHDNLFPSVLGLLGISTPRYSAGSDLFSRCRLPAPVQTVSLSPAPT